MSAIIVKHEMYEPRKLDAIYQNIVAKSNVGKEQFYEIKVDDFPVVGKNNDPARFMDYNEFITPDSKSISVLLFRANGQADKYFFHLTQDSYQRGNQLSGIDQPKPLDEDKLIEKIRMEFQHEDLIKEIARLKKEIADYEEIFQNLTEECEKEKAEKFLKAEKYIELLGNFFLKSDKTKEARAMLGDLAGNGSENTEQDTQNTFKRKKERDIQDVEEQTEEFTEQDRNYIRFIEDIRFRIGDVQLANVMHLLDLMASYPQSVTYANRMVTNFINQKKTEEARKQNQNKQ